MNPDPHTRLFGLVGHPVTHSLGPAMHNAAFKALSVNAVYLAFDTEDLRGSLAGMRAMRIGGFSVTLPHKTGILPLLDDVDDTAKRMGAVNTVVNDSGRLIGLNTDASGALRAVRTQVEPRGLKALVAGAGGAARAAAFALNEAGARVTITNRTASRGESLAAEMGLSFVPHPQAQRHDADILIQATSAGMEGTGPGAPLPLETLRPGLVVMETVYWPWRTAFLCEAEKRGCRVIDGTEMFLGQGAEQFRIWTGLDAPGEIMRKTVLECLQPARRRSS
jgi:shikimate dehydrogenase